MNSTNVVKPPHPEIDKMHEVRDRSQAIGEFLEWLQNEKEWEIASHHEHDESCYNDKDPNSPTRICGLRQNELLAVNYSTEKLLAEYFEIDLRKVDDEKRAILESLRASGVSFPNSSVASSLKPKTLEET